MSITTEDLMYKIKPEKHNTQIQVCITKDNNFDNSFFSARLNWTLLISSCLCLELARYFVLFSFLTLSLWVMLVWYFKILWDFTLSLWVMLVCYFKILSDLTLALCVMLCDISKRFEPSSCICTECCPFIYWHPLFTDTGSFDPPCVCGCDIWKLSWICVPA